MFLSKLRVSSSSTCSGNVGWHVRCPIPICDRWAVILLWLNFLVNVVNWVESTMNVEHL